MAGEKPFEIDLKGEAEILLPAERAILKIYASTKGNDEDKVTNGIIASARKVEAALRDISVGKGGQLAPVDYWSRTSLSKSSDLPYDNEKKINLARVYSARVDFSIRVQKYNKLGSLIHELVAIEHVSVYKVEWVLTRDTQNAQHTKLRVSAAQIALGKAKDYATALGYETVVPLQLHENQAHTRSSSMKGGRQPSDGTESTAKNMAGREEEWEDLSEEAFQYTPEEVKMTQSVDMKFRAE